MTRSRWQLQEAKAHLSEVVKRAERGLVEFIARSPLKGVTLDLTRDRSLPRDIES